MQIKTKKLFINAFALSTAFIIWTVLVQRVDVKPLGINATEIGLASLNVGFHELTGVNMSLYTVTDWMGLVPLFVCMYFAGMGFLQLVKRKSIFKVDKDIIISGVYYSAVILCYLFFEMYPINYRPVLINGFMEASYPSSTALLVLSVMPTLIFLSNRRVKKRAIKHIVTLSACAFSVLTVTGRLFSGVHWLSDIIGSVLLCAGLYYFYKAVILWSDDKDKRGDSYGIR